MHVRCRSCAINMASTGTVTSSRAENDSSLITQNTGVTLELSRRLIKTAKLWAQVTIQEQYVHLCSD